MTEEIAERLASCEGLLLDGIESLGMALDRIYRLEAVLERAQWGGEGFCPVCGGLDIEGHRAGCDLQSLMANSWRE